MKILIISYRFPPFNSVGSVRVGKTAKFLHRFGHKIKVVSCGNQLLPSTLALEIPQEEVTYTGSIDVNWPIQLVLGNRDNVISSGYELNKSNKLSKIWSNLGKWYKHCINIPDGQIGWLPYAIVASNKIIKKWKPNLIYVSAHPISALLAGYVLSKKYHIPWVAELRDLWMDNPNRLLPFWRKLLESYMEKKILSSAVGLITVSEPLANKLKQKFNGPVKVILGGYDLDDYPATKSLQFNVEEFIIVYTGRVYEGFQDPTPLFKALRQLNDSSVKVRFYGRYLQPVKALAINLNVQNYVEIHGPVSYQDSLKVQSEADILLLLGWNDTRDQGVLTGKLYEYIGTGRPILVVGNHSGSTLEDLIKTYQLGEVMNSSEQIALQLTKWRLMKQQSTREEWLDKSNIHPFFNRKNMTKQLSDFLTLLTSD